MLPRKNEVGRKPEDVERSKEIVRELEKMEKVDIRAMDAIAKRRFSIQKEKLLGELFQVSKNVRYDLLDESLNDLRHVNQFLEEPEVVKEEIEFFDVTTHIQPQSPPLKKVKTTDGRELVIDPTATDKWQKENPIRERVEERSRRLFTVKTNRAQVNKLRDLLTGFRKTILHDSSLWPIERFDEEKKKVEGEIAALDLSEKAEERFTKEEWEMLQYAFRTKNEAT